jgi:hypothetical protein
MGKMPKKLKIEPMLPKIGLLQILINVIFKIVFIETM